MEPIGAMLGPVTFHFPDGRSVTPLAVGPWGDDAGTEFDALPPLLRRLRGEWPCVPFGAPHAPAGLPDAWQGHPTQATGDAFHGFSAHNSWHVVSAGNGTLTLEIAYPDWHAIQQLRRTIRGLPGETQLEITLEIAARRATAIPIALHPVFALPASPGASVLRVEGMTGGHTFPGIVEPGVSCITPDRPFKSLDRIHTPDGHLSLSTLPLPFETEELVQLFGVSGRATLRNEAEGYETWIAFDPEVFPSVALWISNRGRSDYPWNNRFTAVGIEPLRGAFDLGPEIGANPDNPIARQGVPTALQLDAAQTFVTTYRLGAHPI